MMRIVDPKNREALRRMVDALTDDELAGGADRRTIIVGHPPTIPGGTVSTDAAWA
jgi:hypothetical protein